MKAYRQDFVAIATLMTDGNPARLTVADITKDFAAHACDHEVTAALPTSSVTVSAPAHHGSTRTRRSLDVRSAELGSVFARWRASWASFR